MTQPTTPEKTPYHVAAREKAKRKLFAKETQPETPASPCPPPDLGFHFTEDELRRIENAGRQAEIDMRTFGQGYSRQPFMVNMDKYNNTPVLPVPDEQPEPPKPKPKPRIIEFIHVTKKNVLNVCAAEYGIKPEDVYATSRKREKLEARQMMSYILFWHLKWRKLHIAVEFKMTHTSVLNAIESFSNRLSTGDPDTVEHYNAAMKKLQKYER